MKIMKRDGKEAEFDKQKIVAAITRANDEVALGVGTRLSDKEIVTIADDVAKRCFGGISVEEIQDLVEDALMSSDAHEVARRYITYRYQHNIARSASPLDKYALSIVDNTNEDVNQENSNKNPVINSTQRDYLAGALSKDISRKYLVPANIMQAHDDGVIHFHDLDYFLSHEHNCGLVNLEDMLNNGTVISDTLIERPHTFSCACNIATQIMAQVASSQYGGQSISLAHLAPFVEETRQKIREELTRDIGQYGVKYTEDQYNAVLDDRVKEDVRRGIQTIQYQVATLMTTNGQAPFITVFMYLNEAKDERTKADLAFIIEECLRQRIQGVKNSVGHWIPPTFPKLIYVLQEDNLRPDDRYYYLTKLALSCNATRLTPDYISEKKMLELKGDVFPCMGCVDAKEVVTIHLVGKKAQTISFGELWSMLSKRKYGNKVRKQRNGKDEYLDFLPFEAKIYDQEKGFVNCYRIIRNTQSQWVKITLDNGMTIDTTIDHVFTTADRKDIRADKLTTDSKLLVYWGATSVEHAVAKLDFYTEEKYSYDVSTESEHFTVSNIWSHNCRSFLTPYKDEAGNPKYYGRFNQGVVTLNLVDVALSSKKDKRLFWKIFWERLELCREALMIRHNRLLGTKSDVAPILWQYGALARLKPGETIDKLLFGGYSTISLGYAGLWECCVYMTGEGITGKKGKKFGLQVMRELNKACAKWRKKTDIAFSLYGTPIESTTYKFAKSNRRKFGVIEGVTDKNYITNSYHVHVTEDIDAFAKFDAEAPFQELSPGGAVSYIEAEDLSKNEEAGMEILRHIYDTVLYAKINTRYDYCQVCGRENCIRVVANDGKLVWKCSKCGNTDQSRMNVFRTTCGYIGSHFWNQGRTAEIDDRKYHTDIFCRADSAQCACGAL